MKRIFSILFALVLVLAFSLVMAVPAAPVLANPGTTYYVSVSGNDTSGNGTAGNPWRTIQYAVNNVSSGDTIMVAAGTYQEDVTINKEVTLQGAGRDTTTILRNAATDTVVLIQANNVKITGFKIDGGPGSPYPCDYDVRVAYGSTLYQNIEVSNCLLTRASYNPVEMYPDSVGHVYKVNDNIIEHYGSYYHPWAMAFIGVGITFGNALNVEAKGNIIRNSEPSSYIGTQYGGYAIYFMDYTGGTVEDNTISDCLYGITINSNVEEVYIDNNTISNCHRGIATFEVFARMHITNNSITTRRDPLNPASAKYRDEWGILIGGDGDFYNSSPPYNWQVDNLQHEVRGNIITGTATTDSIGLTVVPGWYDKDYGASGNFTGNTVSGYKYGIKVWGTHDPYTGSTEDMTSYVHVSFHNNNIESCTTDAAVDAYWSGAVGGINAENNWWDHATGPDNISPKYDYSPWLMSEGGTETTATETATGVNAAASTTSASAAATGGTGSTTVTVAEYAGNPGGAPSFSALGKYMDVYVPDTTGVSSVEIRLYYTDGEVTALGINENSLQLFWWDGSAWVPCSNSGVNTVSNYMWAIITSTTTPSLSQLVGTPLGGGTLFPSVITQDATYVGRYFATLNMNYAMGNSTSVDVRFAYKKSADTAWSYTAWVSETADGTHSVSLEDLYSSTATKWDFKAQLKYDSTVIEGDTLNFFIQGPPSSRCFIATAAYGTPNAQQIDVLREFRDDVLLKSTLGSQFVSLYYRFSPPIANVIAGNEFLRTLVRELLVDPIVWVVQATGNIWRN